MAGFVRAKRVTDPLNDKVKAQLVGHQLSYVSSGSEHSGDDSSPCLSELVYDFLEHDTQAQPADCVYDSGSDRDDSVGDSTGRIEGVLRTTTDNNVDFYRNVLVAHVTKAVEVFSCLRQEKPVLRRNVMIFLRQLGHNAAICKTKWNSSGGLNAGNYEFIDVMVQSSSSTSQIRYFIDLDFASEFQIARPTSAYTKMLESLPRVFVGKSEELKMIVRVTCDAAKKSLKSGELSLPPWRKNRYMQNKWLGPYKRTINQIPANSLTPVLPSVNNGVKCRSVGFDNASNGRLFVRTR